MIKYTVKLKLKFSHLNVWLKRCFCFSVGEPQSVPAAQVEPPTTAWLPGRCTWVPRPAGRRGACVPSKHRPAACPACPFPSAPLPECPASLSNACLHSRPETLGLRTSSLCRRHRAPPPSPGYIILIISHMRGQTRGQVPSVGTGDRRQVSCARSQGPPQARPGLSTVPSQH